MGTTISGQVGQSVILNYQGYNSPLVITKTGTVAPGAFGPNAYNYGVGVAASYNGGLILNVGTIIAADGTPNYRFIDGVLIEGNTALGNQGVILGGNAGDTGYAGAGVVTEGFVDNGSNGFIVGGNASRYYGTGGDGIVSFDTVVNNEGLVVGGNDGQFGSNGASDGLSYGFGGIGIDLPDGGAVFNRGAVVGGNGYYANYASGGYRPGVGGIGIAASYVYNKDLVKGGGGADAVYGGDGVYADTVNNVGIVDGGSVTLGTGGIGVSAGTLVENGGIILGGSGNSGYGGGDGVRLRYGGVVFNGGVIEGGSATSAAYGGDGIDVRNGAAFIAANGTILGGSGPVATIGGIGIYLGGGGTIDLFGTVASGGGQAGFAMDLQGGSELIVQQNADIVGAVYAASGVSNLLQLGNVSAGTVGQLNLGGTVVGFSTIDVSTGNDWALGGTTGELADGQTINGIATDDTLYLEGYTASGGSFVAGTGLVLDGAQGSETLNITGAFAPNSFFITDVLEGTEITLCYLRGTRLMTPAGEAAVEGLRIGDELVTRFGGVRRIKWIGTQSYAAPFLRNNPDKVPVRIGAGALGGGLPRRDLWLTPGHSMLIDGVLVLARDLVNGTTVTQPATPALVEYFQVEFDTHDCVLAEGAWSESYADSPGQRAQFHNAAEFYRLYPDHVPVQALKLCAPRPEGGPRLHAALASLRAA